MGQSGATYVEHYITMDGVNVDIIYCEKSDSLIRKIFIRNILFLIFCFLQLLVTHTIKVWEMLASIIKVLAGKTMFILCSLKIIFIFLAFGRHSNLVLFFRKNG